MALITTTIISIIITKAIFAGHTSGVLLLVRGRVRRVKAGYAAGFRAAAAGPPQHFLYFAPDLQGQGAFRGIFLLTTGADGVATGLADGTSGTWHTGLQNELRPDSR
jgi:hypothetical protein